MAGGRHVTCCRPSPRPPSRHCCDLAAGGATVLPGGRFHRSRSPNFGSPSVGDRQHPRRHEAGRSRPSAPTPTSTALVDATWLRHEVEGYARRAADCDRLPPGPCGQARRRLERATVIHLVRGEHAEMLWTIRPARRPPRLATDGDDADGNDDRRRAAGRFRGGARGRVSERSRPREPPTPPGTTTRSSGASTTSGARSRTAMQLAMRRRACTSRAPGYWPSRRRKGSAVNARRTAMRARPRSPARTRLAAIRARRVAARQSPLTEMPWCAAPPLAEPPRLARLR